MPIPVQMYKCNICKKLHRHMHEAIQCGGAPIEDYGLAVGAIITFEDYGLAVGAIITFEDESQFGSRYSYCTASGTILHTMYSLGRDGVHRQCGVVAVNGRPYEAVVTMGDAGFGPQLISSCDWKYPLGYAAQLSIEGD